MILTMNITNCKRCGKTHIVKPRNFTNPIVILDVEFTKFAMCPETNEPILISKEYDADSLELSKTKLGL